MIAPSPGNEFSVTRNPCTACTPLGAALAFAGIEGAVGLLHGSQGCSTYIRRHLIGHFREPMDLASSSFDEPAAIFGGRDNLFAALDNLRKQYTPALIAVATTCLAETIGDDVPRLLREYRTERAGEPLPELAAVSTPSYKGTHAEGFVLAVRALVEALAREGPRGAHLNLLPGMVSPADLRCLRDLVESFGLDATLLPDYSDTLDGPTWNEYHRRAPGGTPLERIRRAGQAAATIEFLAVTDPAQAAGAFLQERFAVTRHLLGLPIGAAATDRFVAALERLAGRPLPAKHEAARGRLLDSYVDGHKYVAGKRVGLAGDEELVAALAGFFGEIGMEVALCVTGGRAGRLREAVEAAGAGGPPRVLEDSDFAAAHEAAAELRLDLLVGNSSAYRLARALEVPLLRVGLPIHDRLGGARILTVGYEGAQQLYDRVANALLEKAQRSSNVGYTHW